MSADDADDREGPQISVHAGEVDEPAERIFAGPARLGERGADHRNVRRVTRIARVEHATADQRNPHGAEVIRTGDPKLRIAEA